MPQLPSWLFAVVMLLPWVMGQYIGVVDPSEAMELDSTEVPVGFGVSDSIAGAPGSSVGVSLGTGFAHSNPRGPASAPCSMEDSEVEGGHTYSASPSQNPSVSRSATPSISPTPTNFQMFEEAAVVRSLTILGLLAEKLCVGIDRRVIQSLSSSLYAVNSSSPTLITCNNATISDFGNFLNEIQFVNNEVDNEESGFDGVSQPILTNMRSAAGDMDLNYAVSEDNLIEISKSVRPVDMEAYARVRILFENRVSYSSQCAQGIPPMSVLLEAAQNLSRQCLQVFGTGVSSILPENLLPDITTTYINTLFNRMLTVFHLNTQKPSEGSYIPDVTAVFDDISDGNMTPQESLRHIDDCDADGQVANSIVASDVLLNPGKQHSSDVIGNVGVELPAFGTQEPQWQISVPNIVLLNEPPPFVPLKSVNSNAQAVPCVE